MANKNRMGSLGTVRFLVTALLLSGGMLAGTKLVQINQEGRSSAATQNVGSGIPLAAGNSFGCRNAGGICATFSTAYRLGIINGSICSISGLPGVSGTIRTGLCPGPGNVSCCITGTVCKYGAMTYPNATTFCGSSTRVFVCSNGSYSYKGLDCASTGKVCENGKCVSKLSGIDAGAEKCVANSGNCQTNLGTSPALGGACVVGSKAGTYTDYLCSGQYLTGYRCCVPTK